MIIGSLDRDGLKYMWIIQFGSKDHQRVDCVNASNLIEAYMIMRRKN